jgi:hypothetical protein
MPFRPSFLHLITTQTVSPMKPAVAKINRVSVVAVVQDQDRKVRIWFCGSFTWKDGAKICEVDQ